MGPAGPKIRASYSGRRGFGGGPRYGGGGGGWSGVSRALRLVGRCLPGTDCPMGPPLSWRCSFLRQILAFCSFLKRGYRFIHKDFPSWRLMWLFHTKRTSFVYHLVRKIFMWSFLDFISHQDIGSCSFSAIFRSENRYFDHLFWQILEQKECLDPDWGFSQRRRSTWIF